MDSERRRRRGTVLEHHILDCAWLELAEYGWLGFGMERVAARAGTGKASIYARWPNKEALVRRAFEHQARTAGFGPVALSSNLADNLLILLGQVTELLASPFGEAVRGFVAHPQETGQPPLGGIDAGAPAMVVLDIVRAAQEDGQLDAGAVPERVRQLGLVLVTFHFLVDGSVPDEAALRDIVDTIWLPALRRSAAAGQLA